MKNQKAVLGKNGMVACSQPMAAEIGLDILKQGGSAVDAAIAANAALGLMEPHMCGMGGDLFAIVWDAKSQSLHGLNASGRSPKSLSYDLLMQRLAADDSESIPIHDLLAVSVPGAVDGWFELHKRFGALSMSSLLQPTIEFAENGFNVTPVIAGEWDEYSRRPEQAVKGDFDKVFRPNGKAPANGELFKNPDLARSYRAIAERGRAGFYEGEIAHSIAQFMAENNGYISEEDLGAHQSEWVTPLSVNYRGYDVYELPPNGTGMAALQMFKMLNSFDLSANEALSADTMHLMIEVKKLAFEDRGRFYADPDFSPAPIEALLSDEYRDARKALISHDAASAVTAGDPVLRQSDTTYLTTADSEGNMVSLIQSIFHPFASGVVAPGTGFTLQNRGLLFSLDPLHANVYAPNKRPFQTIIPAFIMRDGKPFMSFGVMGGDMQPQGHTQVISNILDFNMELQEAGNKPRWRHDGSTQPIDNVGDSLSDGGVVIMESGFSDEVIADLESRGHKVSFEDKGMGFGGYQAIMCNEGGGYLGASESRKDGCALGY